MEINSSCCVVRNRTLRRQQKAVILKDLAKDVDLANHLLGLAEQAKDKVKIKAYTNLQTIIYASYCDVLNSEV